jgi:hypothetical protein
MVLGGKNLKKNYVVDETNPSRYRLMTLEENMKVFVYGVDISIYVKSSFFFEVSKSTKTPKVYHYIKGSIEETINYYVERYYGTNTSAKLRLCLFLLLLLWDKMIYVLFFF